MPIKINIKDKVNENVCDLSLCELEEIPIKEIAALKRVTVLDLPLNRLATLGKNFSILNRLVKLDLSKNHIRYLPEDFGVLQQLRYLDLFGNQLEHLPLSFGDLYNLRYLDLHNNPLNAALAKITGPCLTNRDCQESAKKTVNFMSLMQEEVLKVKKHYMQAMLSQKSQSTPTRIIGNDEKPCSSYSASFANASAPNSVNPMAQLINNTDSNTKATKKLNKKLKVSKKYSGEVKQRGHSTSSLSSQSTTSIAAATPNNILTKSRKTKRLAPNGHGHGHGHHQRQQKSLTNNSNHNNNNSNNNTNNNKHNNSKRNCSSNNHGAALSSLITFILLLIVNIVLIYMIMFKNPQIAEKLVEAIPYQYRDWILSKTDIFRLRVTDWISEFRTPPDEH